MKRNKPLYGAGRDALTPDPQALVNRYADCPECKKLRQIINRFSKVVVDSQRYIANQQGFIEKLKRVLKEEAQPLTPAPLGRDAKRGSL